ncbi:MAG: Hint domain-containing protein [Pseudomonadota bacterium]|nr:Hint domain-containing protein [Pseudomonadota bacterium]
MADATITVTPYDGALLDTQLLSTDVTHVFADFGAPTSGTLSDDDGWLSDADDGVATFGGDPIDYIGSGTATPGVDIGGFIVPLGASVPLVVFEAGGQIYFHYPEGPPNLLSAVAVVTSLTVDPYEVFTPLCFGAGTMIATARGETKVEKLKAGDLVLDAFGKVHEVIWQGGRTLDIPKTPDFDKWRPVRVRAHAFGPGCPARDTFLSQQHRVYFEHPGLAVPDGAHGAFAPAKQMVNDRSVRIARGRAKMKYHHVLCAEHVVLLANGMPAESLFAGELIWEIASSMPKAVRARLPELARTMTPAAPDMGAFQSEDLSETLADSSPLLGAGGSTSERDWEHGVRIRQGFRAA